MTLRHLILTGFLLGLLTASPAQNPGYLGKKFILQGQMTANPALWGPTPSNKGLVKTYGSQGGGVGFNLHMGGKLSYAFERTTAAYLQVDQYQTAMVMNGYAPAFPANGWDSYQLFYLLKCRQYLAGIQMFQLHKGGLAPFGAYVALNAGMTRIQADIQDYQVSSPAFPNVFSTVNSLKVNPEFTYWSAGFEIGVNHVFFDFLVFQMGIRGNIPIHLGWYADKFLRQGEPGKPAPPPYPSYQTDYAGYNNYFFREGALTRSLLYQFLSVQIGLGFLIF